MRRKYIDIDPVAVDADGLATAQAVAAAGDLTLDGALIVLGKFSPPVAHQIAITSVGDSSGMSFTVTGKDAQGEAQTETITGPNATTTESAKYWSEVSAITASAAATGNISAGTVDEFLTQIIPLNHRAPGAARIVLENVTGTLDVSVEQTFSDLQFGTVDPTWIACHSDLTNATGDVTALLDTHATGVRLVGNSYTSGAELIMAIFEDMLE